MSPWAGGPKGGGALNRFILMLRGVATHWRGSDEVAVLSGDEGTGAFLESHREGFKLKTVLLLVLC